MLQQLDDFNLVKLYGQGDDKAFEVLLARYSKDVYDFIRSKVKDRNLVDDFYQETFVRVINGIRTGKYTPSGKFLSWIFRIANNLIIDHFRRASKFTLARFHEDDGYSLFDSLKEPSLDMEHLMIRNQLERIGKNLISKLPEEQRNVVIMRIYKDMSFKEIAEQTDVNINTALGRMRYAIVNLKAQLKTEHPSWTS